jgi:hypothetical protein
LCRIPSASCDALFILRYNHYPLISSTPISLDASDIPYYFFQIVKDRQPISHFPISRRSAQSPKTKTPRFTRGPRLPGTRILAFEDWWRQTGSNRRPPACKAGALPAELCPQTRRAHARRTPPHSIMVGLVGFEPTTPALSRRCSNRLSYRPFSPASAHVVTPVSHLHSR